MAQVFPRPANAIARASIPLALVGLLLVVGLFWLLFWSDWGRQVGPAYAPQQPVPYSHQLHLSFKLDCRFCHSKVEVSGYANVPTTQVCMSCHSVIRTDSPLLQPVRDSWRTNTPIQWTQVNKLPDFVYFNHSSHIAKGVGCSTCHGDLATMGGNGVYKAHAFFMSWCLSCHRAPERFVRPESEVFNPAYVPPANQLEIGQGLVEHYNIRGANQLTNCVICHR